MNGISLTGLQDLTPVLVPILLALEKKYLTKIPAAWRAASAAFLGFLISIVDSLVNSPGFSAKHAAVGAVLGLVGVGLREVSVNLKQQVGPTGGGGTAASIFFLCLGLAGAAALTGCGDLDATGPYQGNSTLYAADSTVQTAYTAIDAFLKSDVENRASESAKEQAVADDVRARAPGVFKAYYYARAAYVANNAAGSQTSLTAAVNDVTAIFNTVNAVLASPSSTN